MGEETDLKNFPTPYKPENFKEQEAFEEFHCYFMCPDFYVELH